MKTSCRCAFLVTISATFLFLKHTLNVNSLQIYLQAVFRVKGFSHHSSVSIEIGRGGLSPDSWKTISRSVGPRTAIRVFQVKEATSTDRE